MHTDLKQRYEQLPMAEVRVARPREPEPEHGATRGWSGGC
eukprot:COSAG06_NODE_52129_length_307_cov_1.649038_1_plen_39_part_10